MDIFKDLKKLADERAEKYPLKIYPNKNKFEKELDKFAAYVARQAKEKEVRVNEDVILKCGKFRYNPVFICGYYKTGTSLVTSLLDSHKQAVVLLPGSKIFFNVLGETKKSSKQEFFSYLAKEYIKALYNPTGHLPMNLLSCDNQDASLYIKFAVYLKYFIDKAKNMADILSSLACALYAAKYENAGIVSKIWIEKSVTNEKHIKIAKSVFPNAKFIYVARNPLDNLASIKRWYINSNRAGLSNPYMYMSGLKKSLQKAIFLLPRADFYFLKYEDLIKDTENEMRKIAKFLEIEYSDSMLTPSILSIPDRPNTSDTKEQNKDKSGEILKSRVLKYKEVLTQKEINAILNLFRKFMVKFGYEVPKPFKNMNFCSSLFLKIKILYFQFLLKIKNRI